MTADVNDCICDLARPLYISESFDSVDFCKNNSLFYEIRTRIKRQACNFTVTALALAGRETVV